MAEHEQHPWQENEHGMWCPACGNHIAAVSKLDQPGYTPPDTCRHCGFPGQANADQVCVGVMPDHFGTDDWEDADLPDDDKLAALEDENKTLREALTGLRNAVANVRVPQNTADAAVQIMFTIGPALTVADAALSKPAALPAEGKGESEAVAWAVVRWNAEVKNRPLRNIHRSALDVTWRQVIRHFGGDPEALCGPDHRDLMDATPPASPSPAAQEDGI